MAASAQFELTGIMAASDSFERLRLCLVDYLETRGTPDRSWRVLTDAVPASEKYAVPYKLDRGGAADDAGVRGECWISLPGGKSRAADRARLLRYAEELRGKEVVLTVKPRRYSFVSRSTGEKATGTSLTFVGGLEELRPVRPSRN